MAVITLSRQLGSHGEEIATQVAQALGLRLIDAETINRAAQRAGVPQVALAELQREQERGVASQILKALRTMPSPSLVAELGAPPTDLSSLAHPFAGIFSPIAPPLSASLEGYVRMMDLVIRGLAQEGNVLILGRGAQVVLRKHPCALHVQIVAPAAYRVQVVMASQGLSKREAQSRVRDSDRARSDYLRRYYDVDWLDPTLYHLTINTGRIPISTAVELIVTAQQALSPSPNQKDKDGRLDREG